MTDTQLLKGKSVLIVDDEPDILESLKELLDMCDVDTAVDAQTAEKFLKSKKYDIAVLDIMGVNGYELLALANEQQTLTVMLTAHALSPENFAKSMAEGACAYLPKHNLAEIDVLLSEVLEDGCKKARTLGKWFDRVKGYYEMKFGPGWLDDYKGSWL